MQAETLASAGVFVLCCRCSCHGGHFAVPAAAGTPPRAGFLFCSSRIFRKLLRSTTCGDNGPQYSNPSPGRTTPRRQSNVVAVSGFCIALPHSPPRAGFLLCMVPKQLPRILPRFAFLIVIYRQVQAPNRPMHVLYVRHRFTSLVYAASNHNLGYVSLWRQLPTINHSPGPADQDD